MSYFDPKEEVIDLKLTPYGEYLLSIGKLNPTFYAFFDNDIIYDDNWAGVSSEKQSQIEPRIQEETPRMHTQTSFSGREKDFRDFLDQEWKVQSLYTRKARSGEILDETDIALEKITLNLFKPQVEKRKDIFLQPLGKFNSKLQKAPGWNISFLNAPLSSSKEYLVITGSSGATNINIPQLESNLIYQIQRNSGEYNEKYKNNENSFTDQIDHATDSNNASIFYEDGSTINLVEDSLIIRVEETSTDFNLENFEIELFEISEVSDFVGNEEEFLRPLKFQNPSAEVGTLRYTVSNYFSLLVDEEIPEGEICPLIKKDTKKHIFQTKIFDCEELLEEDAPQDFYTDVDDTKDVCD